MQNSYLRNKEKQLAHYLAKKQGRVHIILQNKFRWSGDFAVKIEVVNVLMENIDEIYINL